LAVNCREFWHHNQGKEYNEKALSTRKKIYREEHPDDGESYHSLAADCRKFGEHNQGKEFNEKVLSLRKQICGKEHLYITGGYYTLVADHRKRKLRKMVIK